VTGPAASSFPDPATGPALADEDRARGDLYALLARLYYAAPDRALLDALAQNEDMFGGADDAPLGRAWRALAQSARDADPAALSLEYDSLFAGVGKAEVTPYCSYYLTSAGRERIVVALRDELRDLGLARTGGTHEPEDHVSALCEIMRHLAYRGSESYALECQKRFFLRYISTAYIQLTDASLASAAARFYKDVAHVTRAYFDVESQSFEMV
jgi:TorA maturation chaperone TorD